MKIVAVFCYGVSILVFILSFSFCVGRWADGLPVSEAEKRGEISMGPVHGKS